MMRLKVSNQGVIKDAVLERGDARHHFITATAESHDGVDGLWGHVESTLSQRDAIALGFSGCVPASIVVPESMQAFPSMWLTQSSTILPPSIQFAALSGTATRTLVLDDRPVGTLVEGPTSDTLFLCGILPADTQSSRTDQAYSMWKQMDAALHLADMSMAQVVRTWLYVDHILDWYDDFNKVRDRFFHEHKVYDGLVPASTGIGIGNAAGAAVTACALALRPKRSDVSVRAIPSPLQCPALAYGSSFSRAVEIQNPGYRRLLVSGTASIEPGGATAFVGDMARQVKLTMDVVEAILTSRNMAWNDVVRAVAYVKNGADIPVWMEYARQHGLSNLPTAVMHADICRDDLLFEIEADALKLD